MLGRLTSGSCSKASQTSATRSTGVLHRAPVIVSEVARAAEPMPREPCVPCIHRRSAFAQRCGRTAIQPAASHRPTPAHDGRAAADGVASNGCSPAPCSSGRSAGLMRSAFPRQGGGAPVRAERVATARAAGSYRDRLPASRAWESSDPNALRVQASACADAGAD